MPRTETIEVQCTQTGDLFRPKVKDLSRLDGAYIVERDVITEGNILLMSLKGEQFPVKVKSSKIYI